MNMPERYVPTIDNRLPEAEIARLDMIVEAAQMHLKNLPDEYTRWLDRVNLESEVTNFKKYLESKVLLDLGNGGVRGNDSAVGKFLMRCNVSKYVGVDRFDTKRPVNQPAETQKYTIAQIDATQIDGDMLAFLARQPADSGNIMMNGIDNFVIEPWTDEAQLYLAELRQQIVRVLHVGGIVFGAHVNFIEKLDKIDKRMRKVDEMFDPSRGLSTLSPQDRYHDRAPYFTYEKMRD